ncbi:cell division protein ZapE [Candidatus Vallotia cooleyia]|uniref:cell division protein ZapE n=1 Tax=Candidatus Vallotiella adelgis TaxID=1177211 RepID=UPI001D00C4B7|nr:cell division protein ZapE [Candidatus Vallotia cooleyia]UDG81917.1 Cell division protein ZapE [Candidatus Vallotia cooleyia]
MNVTEYCDKELAKRGSQADIAQQRAISRLQRCYDDWIAYKTRHFNVLQRWLMRPAPPRGIYMWGGVGRGKTFLMDSFYAVVPVQCKMRRHFHAFMRDVHRALKELKGRADPLDELARLVAKRYQLICFDEFHISDIADAMILYLLLLRLFDRGVQFVMTSNDEPSSLYWEGLNRDRVLPAIDLINGKLDVVNVDAGTDYRQCVLKHVKSVYYSPLGCPAERALYESFTQLATISDKKSVVYIANRKIKALHCADGIVWFDFATLCGGPRSKNDYLELATQFHTIILSNVPQMTSNIAAEAHRYMWLIDILYDYRIKLLMSATVPTRELCIEKPLANKFARTISRILEMQSQEYLNTPRRVVDVLLT